MQAAIDRRNSRLALAVIVVPAAVHDVEGGNPSVSKDLADGGYQCSVLNHGARLGIDGEVGRAATTGEGTRTVAEALG